MTAGIYENYTVINLNNVSNGSKIGKLESEKG